MGTTRVNLYNASKEINRFMHTASFFALFHGKAACQSTTEPDIRNQEARKSRTSGALRAAWQSTMRATRMTKLCAGALGISVGCVIGMAPLLFMQALSPAAAFAAPCHAPCHARRASAVRFSLPPHLRAQDRKHIYFSDDDLAQPCVDTCPRLTRPHRSPAGCACVPALRAYRGVPHVRAAPSPPSLAPCVYVAAAPLAAPCARAHALVACETRVAAPGAPCVYVCRTVLIFTAC